jgi:ABC-2 type transport system ATP-binding protein
MEQLAIELQQIEKQFGKTKVLKDINLQIKKNKIYGLLGKNGAGKTTLINIICNQLLATSGGINLFGKELKEHQELLENICIVRESEFFRPEMKVKRIFEMHRGLYPYYDRDLEEKLISYFELPMKTAYKKYSRGMKSLVMSIIGICSNAPLTILDEPTLGLDAVNRYQLYRILLEEYMKNPRTIIVSTHIIEEIENLLEEVVVINKGEVLLNQSMEEIKDKACYLEGDIDVLKSLSGVEERKISKLLGRKGSYIYFGILTKEDQDKIKEGQIEKSPISLQKLFVELTKGKEFTYETN